MQLVAAKRLKVNNGKWVQALELVRKLLINVSARIRNLCL